MDINKFKKLSNSKNDKESLREAYEQRKNEIKMSQMVKVKKDFIAFYQLDKDFRIDEKLYDVDVFYNSDTIKLAIDTMPRYENQMAFNFKILNSIGNDYNVETNIITNGSYTPLPPDASKNEKDKRELEYFQDFLSGKIEHTFSYIVKETNKKFDSINELLKSLN